MGIQQKSQLNTIGYACEIWASGEQKICVQIGTTGAGVGQAESIYYGH